MNYLQKNVAVAKIYLQKNVGMLCKDNKKFIYGALRKGARANDFEIAIQRLVDSGLVYKVPKCTKPALPLDIYEDLSCFKLLKFRI